jgi:hypothetical protein
MIAWLLNNFQYLLSLQLLHCFCFWELLLDYTIIPGKTITTVQKLHMAVTMKHNDIGWNSLFIFQSENGTGMTWNTGD